MRAHRRNGEVVRVPSAFALTDAVPFVTRKPTRAPRQPKGESSRAGAYWIARLVADMLGIHPPAFAAFGFDHEPAKPTWWDAAAIGTRPSVETSALSDALATLGVDSSASEAEIKRAYRRLAGPHHPDKFDGASDEVKAQHLEAFRLATEALAIALAAEINHGSTS